MTTPTTLHTRAADMPTTEQLLREALAALECGIWDYGPGQDQHDACTEMCKRISAHLTQLTALDELVRENERLGLYEPKVGVSAPYYPAMPQAFADYMAQQMPPGTVISEPLWWAPRIWRTAMRLYAAPPAAPRTLTDERIAELMEQAQVFASAWSLVGGVFDDGDGIERAEEEKARLRAMLSATPEQL